MVLQRSMFERWNDDAEIEKEANSKGSETTQPQSIEKTDQGPIVSGRT